MTIRLGSAKVNTPTKTGPCRDKVRLQVLDYTFQKIISKDEGGGRVVEC